MAENRIKKVLRRICLSALALVLALTVAALAVFFWHFPRYVMGKEPVTASPDADSITVMSYNLRCLTPLDLGEKSWFYRAELVAEDLRTHAPAIVGFQEATRWQYDYLMDILPEYGGVIVYRDDSLLSEGCPIVYHSGLFELVDQGAFWLSETPEVMSKDWGAAHYRICSYVILKEKAGGKEFVVFNTHLDHVSNEARVEGINVILDKIADFGGLPAVIMGDLNAEENSQTYRAAMQHFLDARYEAPRTVDTYTYHGWGVTEKCRRIDYVLLSRNGFRAESYTALTQPHDGVWSSDHAPLVVELVLE